MRRDEKAETTAGPWRLEPMEQDDPFMPLVFDGYRLIGANNICPAIIFKGLPECEADARLIAAAPAMRAALVALFEHCAMIHKHWGDDGNQKEGEAAIQAARAALALADGGEPR